MSFEDSLSLSEPEKVWRKWICHRHSLSPIVSGHTVPWGHAYCLESQVPKVATLAMLVLPYCIQRFLKNLIICCLVRLHGAHICLHFLYQILAAMCNLCQGMCLKAQASTEFKITVSFPFWLFENVFKGSNIHRIQNHSLFPFWLPVPCQQFLLSSTNYFL